jgi:hypothetical protein
VPLADADARRLCEHELERGAHQLPGGLARGSRRRHRRARVGHRESRVEQVDLASVSQDGNRAVERGERLVEAGTGHEQVVDGETRLSRQDLEPKHVDAVRGEMLRDGGETSRTVANT